MNFQFSKYTKNVFTLTLGNGLSQFMPLILSPFLSRIYSPKEIGIFGIFFSITQILTFSATGNFETAIPVATTKSDKQNLFILTLLSSLIINSFMVFGIFLFQKELTEVLTLENGDWLLYIPFVSFLSSTLNAFQFKALSTNSYKAISFSNIIRSFVKSAGEILFGIALLGYNALIISYTLGVLAGITAYKRLKIQKINKLRINPSSLLSSIKKYKKQPLFLAPSALLSQISIHFNSFIFTILMTVQDVGFYAYATRIIGAPLTLFGKTFADVLLQTGADELRTTGTVIVSYKNTLIQTLIIGIPIFAILFFFGESIFSFVYGERWIEAGVFAEILAPLFLIRFVARPLSSLMIVFQKQQFQLLWQIVLVSIIVFSFYLTRKQDWDAQQLLTFQSIALSVHYLFLITFVSWLVFKKSDFKK